MSEWEEGDGRSLLKGARSRCLPSALGSMSEDGMKRARVKVRARARGSGFPTAVLERGAAGGEHPGLGAASL